MINQNNPSQSNQRDVNAILKAISERLTRQGQQEQGSSQKSSQQNSVQFAQNSYQESPQMQSQQSYQAQHSAPAFQQAPQQMPQMTAQDTSSFDDNFSFDDLDFTPTQDVSQTRSEINNLLRSYNNNKKSSYNQAESQEGVYNQSWGEEASANEVELEQTELSFESEDEFDSFESEEEYDSFEEENEEELDSFESEDEFDSFEDENEEETDEFGEFAEFEQGQPQSNVHFLNTAVQNNSQASAEYEVENDEFVESEEEYEEMSGSGANQLAMQIEYAVSQAISDCVQQWCQDNLESLCREVIKDELRKTA